MKGRYATDAAMSLTKSLDEVSYFSLFSYSVAGYLLTLPIDGVKAASNTHKHAFPRDERF